ncbi:MAG: inositol monophosphatase family protein [bacterium]|nr:inositol monophosphatase family protein [bacterium]
MNQSDACTVILDFCREAGEIARRRQYGHCVTYKSDGSRVTEADKEISELLNHKLRNVLTSAEHLLVDEEQANLDELLVSPEITRAKYLWVVDPIDGTTVYSAGHFQYGISIGILKDCKPWLGAVYFPALRELFYDDGDEGFLISEAFTVNESHRKIATFASLSRTNPVFIGLDPFLGELKWQSSSHSLILPGSAVAALCWPLAGRAIGGLFYANLWDLAGAWPLVKRAGMELHNLRTGDILQEFSVEKFQGNPKNRNWRIHDYYIVCQSQDFQRIQNMILYRQPSLNDK